MSARRGLRSPQSRAETACSSAGGNRGGRSTGSEVHKAEEFGPYPRDDRFAVRFQHDITQKQSGQRITMDAVGAPRSCGLDSLETMRRRCGKGRSPGHASASVSIAGAGLALVLFAACAGNAAKVTAPRVGSVPPAIALRCARGQSVTAPEEWPHLPSYETALDGEGRKRVEAAWKEAQDRAMRGRCVEACDGFRAIWRQAVGDGYRAPTIGFGYIGEDCCAEGGSEFLPYLVPESCLGYRDWEANEGIADPETGLGWVSHYLTGLVRFRWGQYAQARECFGWVPKTHGWAGAAADCLALIEAIEGDKGAGE